MEEYIQLTLEDLARDILYGKTSAERSHHTKERISGESSKRSQKPKFQYLNLENGGVQEWYELESLKSLGGHTTLNTGESPSVAKESTLSEILQVDAPEKYNLSPKACAGILRRADDRNKKLPPLLELALKIQAEIEIDGELIERLKNDDREITNYTLQMRSGCEGGGKGPLVQTDKSACLTAAQTQTLFQAKRSYAVFENHSQDTRFTGPLDIAPTVAAKYGTGGNNTPFVVCMTVGEQLTAYSIGAYNSGGMKSDNPESGIYETDVCRTLDANCGNPACNQGGIAIVKSFSFFRR